MSPDYQKNDAAMVTLIMQIFYFEQILRQNEFFGKQPNQNSAVNALNSNQET